jgi:hypothetical protein
LSFVLTLKISIRVHTIYVLTDSPSKVIISAGLYKGDTELSYEAGNKFLSITCVNYTLGSCERIFAPVRQAEHLNYVPSK